MDMNQFDPNNLVPQEPQPHEEPVAPVAEEFSAFEPLELERTLEANTVESDEVSAWLTQMSGQSNASEPIVEQQPLPFAGGMPPQYPMPPQPKKSKSWLWIMLICIGVTITLVIGCTVGFFAGRLVKEDGGQVPFVTQEDSEDSSTADKEGGKSSFDISTGKNDGKTYSYEQIVEKVSPAIVNITIYSADGKKGSYASGIIMDAAQGYILTNDHIYSEIPNAKFLITLNDGREFTAEFVSGDTRNDIAILKINNPKDLTAATFSTDTLTVGQQVLVMGQSYGYADTVSEGIVSAIDRRLSLSSGSYSERFIQTTAAINPGNSGGALVNLYGQVVGMPSAKISSEEVESLGFAIPTDRLLSVVDNLQKNGTVKGRAKLGITYNELGTVVAEVKNLPVGILVQSVDSKSDAAKKGIRSGDVITKVNGKEITIAAVLLDVIENAKAGDEITLEVYGSSDKKTKTVKVTLMEAESGHSYQTKDEDMNDLPENPYEFYFGEE